MADRQRTRQAFRFRRTITSAAALLIAGAAAAEEPLLSEQEFYAELPVVLSASRLSQPLDEAPAAVTVIDRQLIAASGARNLSEVMRLVPGFVVGFASGHQHVASYHGLADAFSRRMQVLIDGRAVYLPSFGGVAWSDLPLALDDIERIEVIRGPNAASYGANAFLGTINITTRHAAADPGAFVRLSAGSNDIRDGVLRVAGGEGALYYRLTAGYQQDKGYSGLYDSRETTQFGGRVDYSTGRNDFEYQFGYSDGLRGVGKFDSLTDYPRDQQNYSRFQQLRWRHGLAEGGDVTVQLYHNHHEWNDRYSTLPVPIPIPPFNVVIPVSLDTSSDRYDFEVQHTFNASDTLRVVWGVGARRDESLSPSYLGTPDAVPDHLYRVFGSVEWHPVQPVVVNVGAMYEHYEITGGAVSPRVAVNYHLSPGHTLRAGISSATRQPVAFEEQSDARYCATPACTIFDQIYLSSGQLRPERINSGELGYLGRITPALSLDLRLYRDRVYELIGDYSQPYPDINNKILDFRNGGTATVLGSELQLQYQPQAATRVIVGMANTQIDSNNFDDHPYSRSAPRNSLSLLALHDLPAGWQLSGAFYYQDEMTYIDEDPIEPVRRLDLRVAYRFALPGAAGEAALVLQNLLGHQANYVPELLAGPGGYFTLSMQMR